MTLTTQEIEERLVALERDSISLNELPVAALRQAILLGKPHDPVELLLPYSIPEGLLEKNITTSSDVLLTVTSLAPSLAGGRLTTETLVPVSTGNRSAQGTLYYTPTTHARIALYDGTSWVVSTFSEISLSLTGLMTSGKNYDVFVWNDAGTLKLELGAAWTNDTTRSATGIVRQNGVWVKQGTLTKRYVGTIRATGTGTTEDSAAKRFVWNYNNRKRRSLVSTADTTDTWMQTALATWREARGASNRVEVVLGVVEDAIEADVKGMGYSGGVGNGFVAVGVGLDSTTANSAQRWGDVFGVNIQLPATALYRGQPTAAGYHYLAWLELTTVSPTIWYGNGGGNGQMGLIGTVFT